MQNTQYHHVQGSASLKLRQGVTDAVLFGGPGDCYRYRLRRSVLSEGPLRTVMFLTMQPSIVDPEADDPTVEKCWQFAQAWGFNDLFIGGVFAYRCNDRRRLDKIEKPFGRNNRAHLLAMARQSERVVCGYGAPPMEFPRRSCHDVAMFLRYHDIRLHVLQLSLEGVPCHPLPLPLTLEPHHWEPSRYPAYLRRGYHITGPDRRFSPREPGDFGV